MNILFWGQMTACAAVFGVIFYFLHTLHKQDKKYGFFDDKQHS